MSGPSACLVSEIAPAAEVIIEKSREFPDLSAGAIKWPIVSLDFEASSLCEASYPIEVGLAIWTAPDAPIRSWSTLIAPTPYWIRTGVWSEKSATVHNIPRASLHSGMHPTHAVRAVNDLIGIGGIALTDGGKHDRHWLLSLEGESSDPIGFALASWDIILPHLSPEQIMRYCEFEPLSPVTHRAGPDAVLNIRSFASALGITELREEAIKR